jgi:hypothetical protein
MLANVNTQTIGKIKFENKFRREMLFEIASSRDEVMSPNDKLMKYAGR